MGVLHGLADGDEQFEPGPDRQPVAVAVVGDRLAFDQLHHEERLAGLGGAAVVNAGDVGVVHQGQCLPLGVEPGQDHARVHADLDQLERHLAVDRLGLLGPVDGAHAPLAEDFQQRVPPGDDLPRDESKRTVRRRLARERGDRGFRSRSPVASSAGRRISEAGSRIVSRGQAGRF